MTTVFVPCQNGLGHIKRSQYLTNYFRKKKIDTKIACSHVKAKKLKIKNYVNLEAESNLINFCNKRFYANKYKYQIFNKYKNIIIDNEIENSLLINKNIYIYANFFWTSIYNKNNKIILEILKKKKIKKIFTNYLFFHKKSFKNIKNYEKVGFFDKPKHDKYIKRENILISLGTSEFSTKQKIIKEISTCLSNFNQSTKFYVDLDIYKILKKQKNIYLANHTNKMFKSISVAIIKPGFSIIHDCLKYGISIICYDKYLNNEFKYNAKILLKHKLGIKMNNLKKCIMESIKVSNNEKIKKKQFIKINNLNWRGEEKIVKNFLKKNNL